MGLLGSLIWGAAPTGGPSWGSLVAGVPMGTPNVCAHSPRHHDEIRVVIASSGSFGVIHGSGHLRVTCGSVGFRGTTAMRVPHSGNTRSWWQQLGVSSTQSCWDHGH